MRREGRPGEKAILTSRVIDRPIRPLFPKDMRNDVSVVMYGDERSTTTAAPEITAMIGTSIAISISQIPWKGPHCGRYRGPCGRRAVSLTPPPEQREKRSDLHADSGRQHGEDWWP